MTNINTNHENLLRNEGIILKTIYILFLIFLFSLLSQTASARTNNQLSVDLKNRMGHKWEEQTYYQRLDYAYNIPPKGYWVYVPRIKDVNKVSKDMKGSWDYKASDYPLYFD